MSKDIRKWSWWAIDLEGPDEKPEVYELNEQTREDVLAAALREWPDQWVAIVEATQDGPFKARPFDESGDCMRTFAVFDYFLDENGERWGEDGPECQVPLDALAKALNETVERFIADNIAGVMEGAWAFTATRNAEVLFMESPA